MSELYVTGDDERGYTADVSGIDQPDGTVLAWNKDYITIKVPGHSYWSGRGEQGYASPEIVVYRIIEQDEKDRTFLRVEIATGWDTGRNKHKVRRPNA